MQKRITKDLLIYLLGQALPAMAAFVTVPIYTRMFSPDQFGHYVLAGAAVEFLLLGTVTGFGQAAVRFFSTYRIQSRLSNYFAVLFGSVGLITLAATAVSASLLMLCRSLIASDLYPLLWAALALFVVSTCNVTLMDVLRGQEKSRWHSIFSISQSFGSIILGLILVLNFGMGISGLIWGQTFSFLLMMIPLSWLATRSVEMNFKDLDRSEFRQLWAFALPFAIGNLAYWTLSLSDRYIIEFFRGSYEVGLYSVANKISWRTIQLLVYLFFLVPAPVLSRLWDERGRQSAEDALTSFTRLFFLIVIPAVSGIAVVAAPLVRLLADEAYFAGYPAIWLLASASMGLGLTNLGISGCLVTNQTFLIARNQCLAAGAGLLLNLILVPRIGFMGAALSAVLSFFFLAALQAFTSARFLTWRWPLGSLWRVLIASAAMAASVFLVQMGLRSETIVQQVVNLSLSIAVGALVYGLGLWVLGEISPSHVLELLRPERSQTSIQPATSESGQR